MIIPANYAQANIRFTGTNLPTGAEITLGFNTELYAGPAYNAALAVLQEFQAANIRAQISPEVTIDSCLFKKGPNDTGESAVYSSPLAGTAASTAAGPQVAWLVRKVTGFGGRTGRGRFYIPGMSEAVCGVGGLVGANQRALLDTALGTFRTNLNALGLVPTLLHGSGSPVQTPMPITAFVVDTRAATQRRRLRR